MPKTDTVLQLVGVAAIAALGIPVGLSVKFRNGAVDADDIYQVLDVPSWKIEVSTPSKISKIEIRLEESVNSEIKEVAALQVPFEKGSKLTAVGAFIDGGEVHLYCESTTTSAQLPGGALSSKAKLHNIGGKGKESGNNRFDLAEDSGRTISVVVLLD